MAASRPNLEFSYPIDLRMTDAATHLSRAMENCSPQFRMALTPNKLGTMTIALKRDTAGSTN
jgi:hypothetical protein